MNLDRMKVFCCVVEKGSFRTAGEALYLSQPSVSYHVSALEEEYKVRLLHRNRNGICPTPEGRALYMLGKEMLLLADSLPNRLRALELLECGTLSIGVANHIAHAVLPETLKEFHKDFPNINVSVYTGMTIDVVAKLKSGEVEFAIAGKNFACSNDPELTVRALCHEKLVFVVPKGHRLEGKFVEPKDLESIPVMGYVARHPLSYFVDKVLMNNQIKPMKKVEADSIDLLVRFVEEGLGAGIVSESGVRKKLRKGSVGLAYIPGLDTLQWDMDFLYATSRGLSYAGWEMQHRISTSICALLGCEIAHE